MKTLKLIALAAFALLFSQCKTTSPTAPSGPAPSFTEVVKILDTTEKKFLQFADSTHGNPWEAIMRTTEWVKTQPNLQAVEALDSTYINILLKSGLQTTFSFDQIDAGGHSLFKGGGGAGTSKNPALSGNSILSKNSITNRNVLLYLAGFSQFYTAAQIQTILDYFTNSGLGLTVTVLKDDQCSYKTVESFKDYGLVIIDTHGGPDVFLTGSSITIHSLVGLTDDQAKATVIAQLGQDCWDKLLSGMLRYSVSIGINLQIPGWQQVPVGYRSPILVTTDYLHTLHSMPSTVVFGNMCYSGQSSPVFNNKTPMRTAFLEKSPISYYGYAFDDGTSASVGVPFSNAILDTFVRELVADTDSTGIAHLQEDGSEFAELKFVGKGFFLKHFGADDYSYSKCGSPLTDVRDKHVYNTVCIGKQVWMAENLDYDVSGGDCYDKDTNNCKKFGKLYDFQTALAGQSTSNTNPSGVQGICPKGWHLPSASEWDQLISFVGGAKSGKALESTTFGGTNSSGFNALAAGRVAHDYYDKPVFDGISSITIFTTSSLKQYTINDVDVGPAYISAPYVKASCRCVKDP